MTGKPAGTVLSVVRLAFSVVVELDAGGNIVAPAWFGRTVMRSSARLTYDDAQHMIEGPSRKSADRFGDSARSGMEG